MKISPAHFLRTGYLGEICVGSSSEAIQALLGPPEASAKSQRKFRQSDIWLYGGVEFWSEQSQPQSCTNIWIERTGHGWEDEFKMPANTVTEDWDLQPHMVRDSVEAYLQHNNISAFQPEPKKPDKNGYVFAPRKLVLPASGVSLGFDEDWRLNAFHAEQHAEHL